MGISCIYLKNMYFLFCWLYGPDGVFAFQIWRCRCALKVLTTSESHIQGQHAKKHSACGQSLMWARTYTHTVNPGKEGIYWIWGHKHRGGVWVGVAEWRTKGKQTDMRRKCQQASEQSKAIDVAFGRSIPQCWHSQESQTESYAASITNDLV